MISETIKSDSTTEELVPLLICPYCKKNIPLLELRPGKFEMKLNVKCPCLNDEMVVKLGKFIKDLSNKARPLADFKVECNTHRKSFTSYCKQCQVNCCDDCLDHQGHQLIPLHLKEQEDFPMNALDEAKTKNELLCQRLIKRIKDQIEYLKHIKRFIFSHYRINTPINQDLKLLYQSLCKTILKFKSSPCYELMELQQTIVINTHQYSEGESIEEAFEKLKDLYVLKQTVEDEKVTYIRAEGHDILGLVQLSDGRVASCSRDDTIQLMETTTFKCIDSLRGHAKSVNCIIELTNGRLASCSFDKTMKIWNLATLQCLNTITIQNNNVDQLIQLKDGRLALFCHHTLKLYDPETSKCNLTLPLDTDYVRSLIQLKDGRLAFDSNDNIILRYPTVNGDIITLDADQQVTYITQLTDGTLVSVSFENVKLWNIETNKCISVLIGPNYQFTTLIELKDGRLASYSSEDDTIKIWKVANNTWIRTLTRHRSNVNCLIQLSDGRLAAGSGVFSDDKNISIWEI